MEDRVKRYPFLTMAFVHGDIGRLKLGDKVSFNNTLFNTRSGFITVGDRVIFGHDVMVLTGRHNSDGGVPISGHDITIGSDVFIGSRAIIIGGVAVGDHSSIGAGSVVTKDVPPNSFVAGNPAKIIRG